MFFLFGHSMTDDGRSETEIIKENRNGKKYLTTLKEYIERYMIKKRIAK